MRNMIVLTAMIVLVLGLGCANGSTPVTPDKGIQGSMEEYFNSFEITSPAVAEYTYSDLEGNVLSTGLIGKNTDGSLYIMENRGADCKINLTPLCMIMCIVTYNNPAGTIETGPNSGLPFYYIGQTMDYNIYILSKLWKKIGDGPWGPAHVRAEQRYAGVNAWGMVYAKGPMPGQYAFDWYGVIAPGYTILNDTYYIPSGTEPGLNVTTVRIKSKIFCGLLDIIWFDCIAGVWDPIDD